MIRVLEMHLVKKECNEKQVIEGIFDYKKD
ncbi:hypothetical protein CEAn_00047 [Coxiella endosymbiont of Amblyomma nuttalli]|nr:hypothetical protein CEAn_00047 [Coxiella endosymbiont of Amblyomma nuttalli]